MNLPNLLTAADLGESVQVQTRDIRDIHPCPVIEPFALGRLLDHPEELNTKNGQLFIKAPRLPLCGTCADSQEGPR